MAAQVVDPLRAELHDVLITQPHEIINWGHPLTGACKTTARELVSEGPWGASDQPRDRMTAAGCEAEARFNHDPSFERLASAWMAAAVSIIVLVLLLLAVITMLVASLFFILRFSWLYLALIGFQAPGAARELAWGWLVGLLKDLATVVAMSFVISYLMLGAAAFLTEPHLALAERFAVLIVLSLAMLLYRKRVLTGVNAFAERLRSELGSFRLGSTQRAPGGWTSGNGGSAGLTGYGLGHRARSAMLDVPGSTAFEAAYTGRRFRSASGQFGGSRAQRAYRRQLEGPEHEIAA